MRPSLLVTLISLLVALVLTGCGSTQKSAGKPTAPTSSPEPTATAEAAYLVRADTDRINRAALAAQDAGGRAGSQRVTARCNRIDAYPAWRACWHDVLDPFRTTLRALGTTMTSFEDRGFPDTCTVELRRAAATFGRLSGMVGGLLRGIDSPSRAAQTKAVNGYWRTLRRVGRAFSRPFGPVTQACYSPRDLASINASPSPSASSSSSPSATP